MNRIKCPLMLAVALVATFTLLPTGNAQQISTKYQVVEGQMHPDFIYPRIDTGEQVSLSQFRGKKVLLIHFASW